MKLRNALAASCLLAAGALTLRADVIPPDHHPVARCVRITNLDEFPDIVLVGGYVPVSSPQTVERYIVDADSCLTKGYKFNSFHLFWILRSYFEKTGLENLPLGNMLPSVSKRMAPIIAAPETGLISIVDPYGGTVHDSNPIVREDLLYRLYMATGRNEPAVFLSEQITTDTSGTEQIETFELPLGITGNPSRGTKTTVSDNQIRAANGYLLFSPGLTGPVAARLIDCHGRTVLRFSRECQEGYTYHLRTTGLSAGLYWLQATSARASSFTAPVRIFR